MMLNEKALEAATLAFQNAYKKLDAWGSLVGPIPAILQAAIKAYLAALPDEGGLVGRLRKEADDPYAPGDPALLREAADALEVARAKSSIPEGWRLVPKVPTREWALELAHLRGITHDTRQDLMETTIGQVIAAAPETSDE